MMRGRETEKERMLGGQIWTEEDEKELRRMVVEAGPNWEDTSSSVVNPVGEAS